jgi:hypothetical protein
LILVQGERQESSFTLLYVDIQFSQQHLLRRLTFLHCVLGSFVEDQLAIDVWFISGSSVLNTLPNFSRSLNFRIIPN